MIKTPMSLSFQNKKLNI